MTGPHIVILTIGTEGDVRPYVALGRRLIARGCRVTIAAPDTFRDLVEHNGPAFAPLNYDIRALLASDRVKRLVHQGVVRRLLSYRRLRSWAKEIIDGALATGWQACQGADLILYHPKTMFAQDFAEALGVPAVFSAFQPLSPTGAVPLCALRIRSRGSWVNRLTYRLLILDRVLYGGSYDAFRRGVLGLAPRSRWRSPLLDPAGRHVPTLYAYSTAVVPRPPDWPDEIAVTGYWWLDDAAGTGGQESTAWQPSPDLRVFLDAGAPPVYIGFGSMPWDAAQTTAVVLEGVARWGGRALVATGWGGLAPDQRPDALSPQVFALTAAPHDRLFPLTAAVVHHGGAGTTAAGLRAGRPSFVCPVLGDQGFFGERVHALGAGPPPIPLRRLTPATLAERLAALVGTPRYVERAGAIAAALAAEDGAGRAADRLIGLAGVHQHRATEAPGIRAGV